MLAQALQRHIGLGLPVTPRIVSSASHSLVWAGPDQWHLIATDRNGFDELLRDLAPLAAVSDQSDGRAALRLSGPKLRETLAKGCMLDLHPSVFPAGAAALTASLIWVCISGGSLTIRNPVTLFEIMVARSMAGSFWSWLSASAAEFGCGWRQRDEVERSASRALQPETRPIVPAKGRPSKGGISHVRPHFDPHPFLPQPSRHRRRRLDRAVPGRLQHPRRPAVRRHRNRPLLHARRLQSGSPEQDARRACARPSRPIAARFAHDLVACATVDERKRVMLLVSKFDHCLADLLYRWRIGELPMEIAGDRLQPSARDLRSPTSATCPSIICRSPGRPRWSRRPRSGSSSGDRRPIWSCLRATCRSCPTASSAKLPGRCINIHHSFLPGFKGAKPYHQAHARGVKLIGATAHYVTADLDEGPIIEQDVERISHRDTPDDLVRKGRDIERRVLARAVLHHLEDRVVLNGKKTVVFTD